MDVGFSAGNMALIRRLATNIIRTFDSQRGRADARRSAAYAPNYLRGLLGKVFIKYSHQNILPRRKESLS
ncbi:Transposase, IS4 family protein [Neochlamydia sp. TUME1]|nr:Transposase, IS4 family protein [Neochlamydia sp. TUME1]